MDAFVGTVKVNFKHDHQHGSFLCYPGMVQVQISLISLINLGNRLSDLGFLISVMKASF